MIDRLFNCEIALIRVVRVNHHVLNSVIIALQQKGKFTTDPRQHTGEGIFFCQRAFDCMTIKSSGLAFIRDKNIDDWFIKEDTSIKRGSEITLMMHKNSSTELARIFEQYQSEDMNFNKTEIIVKFSKLGSEQLIARSQAKELFKT